MRMNHTHPHHIIKEHQDKQNPIYTLLLVACSSFIVGAVPIIYGLSLDANSSEQNVTTTPLTPWSVLAEKEQ